MIGCFSKDVWGIVFEKLEIEFDPISLNNLSISCKKLHEIDIQRRKVYISSYEKNGPLIEKLKKGRQDYVDLVKHSLITHHFYKYEYFRINFNQVLNWLKDTLFFNPEGMNVISGKKLHNLSEKEIVDQLLISLNISEYLEKYDSKDVRLIALQINVPKHYCIFSYIKNKGDIINAIMDLQFNLFY